MPPSTLEPFPTLETERLVLGPLGVRHVEGLLEVLGNREVTRFHDLEPFENQDQALRFIAEMMSRHAHRRGIRWAVTERSSNHFLGTVGLNHIAWEACKCTLGYEFSQSVWGQGFGTEAVRAVVSFGHGPLGLNRIEAAVLPENLASLRVLAKLGFSDEGLLRAVGYWKGQFQDLRILSLLSPNPKPPALNH